jgi:hypothetical protein
MLEHGFLNLTAWPARAPGKLIWIWRAGRKLHWKLEAALRLGLEGGGRLVPRHDARAGFIAKFFENKFIYIHIYSNIYISPALLQFLFIIIIIIYYYLLLFFYLLLLLLLFLFIIEPRRTGKGGASRPLLGRGVNINRKGRARKFLSLGVEQSMVRKFI